MKTSDKIQLANRLLQELNQHQTWMKTGQLLRTLGLEHFQHAGMRDVLKRLSQKHIVRKSGVGSFHWKINVTRWDSDRPFKTPSVDEYVQKPEAQQEEMRTAIVQGDWQGERTQDEVEETFTPESLKEVKECSACKELRGEVHLLRDSLYQTGARVETLEGEVKRLEELAKRTVRTLELKRYDGKVHKLRGKVLPKQFERALGLARCRRPVLLVGPAGCGKTHLGRLIADALKFDFGTLSCTAGTSETHLLGRSLPNLTTGKSRFQTTEFLRLYEGGGLFLFDEIDAADANLLLALNSAIGNGYCNVPSREGKPHAAQHEDFVAVATANTYGRGATRVYAGRNQLDEATLDRFRIGLVECDYDEAIEASVCPDDELRSKLQDLRRVVDLAGMRRVVSTRFMQDAYVMVKQDDWTHMQVLEALTAGWSDEEKNRVAREAL